MFVSGMNPFSSLAFSFQRCHYYPSTSSSGSGLQLYGSKLRINSASLFSLGFIRCSSLEA